MEQVNILNTIKRSAAAAIDGHETKYTWPEWVGYTFGSLFIVLGICCFALIPRAHNKMKAYKKSQLDAYNKKYNKREVDYTKTGMYLPAMEKIKYFLPLCFAIVFMMLGIGFMIGHSLGIL